ncbi:glycine--tRNA ligase subunit beta, partial [Enterobacter hormaechei]|nr:glycine--tRNA ligase subunit beta [Enterobacter hormaechei]
ERMVTDKGEWLLYRAQVKGREAKALLAEMVSSALGKLPIPKLMRWGDKETQFVRPVHTVTMLLGSDVVDGNILGIQSDRIIRGHRFMGEAEFPIENAEQYPAILQERGR